MAYFLTDTNKRIVQVGFICIGIGLLALLFYQYNPAESSFFIPCPFHHITGLHCPGCGSQRALHQLIHFNIYDAFRYNPLLVVIFPLVIWALVIRVYNFIYQTKYRVTLFYNNIWVYGFFGIVILFWVARNIPFEPFSCLAPTGS